MWASCISVQCWMGRVLLAAAVQCMEGKCSTKTKKKKSRFCQLYALTELYYFQVRRLLLAKSSCSSRSKAVSSELELLQQPPAGCRLCSPAPAHSPPTALTQHQSTQHPVQDGSSICLPASAALRLQTQHAIHLRFEDPLRL